MTGKKRTTRGKNKIITDWLKDPKKMELWAVRKLYFTALTLEDILNDPGVGVGAVQAQITAATKLYDLIAVMLEDILPNAEDFKVGGKGSEVPKHEAGEQENARQAAGRTSFRVRSPKAGGSEDMGSSPVELYDRGGSGDGEADLLDPGREG